MLINILRVSLEDSWTDVEVTDGFLFFRCLSRTGNVWYLKSAEGKGTEVVGTGQILKQPTEVRKVVGTPEERYMTNWQQRDCFGCYWHLVKISCQCRIMFTEKSGDVFNTYFTHFTCSMKRLVLLEQQR